LRLGIGTAHDDIFDLRRFDTRALEQRGNDARAEVVGANMTSAPLRVK
jgi:hypothetical protein